MYGDQEDGEYGDEYGENYDPYGNEEGDSEYGEEESYDNEEDDPNRPDLRAMKQPQPELQVNGSKIAVSQTEK